MWSTPLGWMPDKMRIKSSELRIQGSAKSEICNPKSAISFVFARQPCARQEDPLASPISPLQIMSELCKAWIVVRQLPPSISIISARAGRQVFGSADHSEVDRTSDRAGAVQE